ncbi:LysR substrate-binding domain-containing protein [Salipiger bermudensis]|uniref:LysR substrate-binding domain-containing protein n=1 Tax=Salipiger bermudensis TaxID=344736 RepID=UPI00351693F5
MRRRTAALRDRLAPAQAEIDEGLSDLSAFRDAPAGIVRLTTFLAQRLPAFLAMHPRITAQVTVDDKLRDIVADGFDAGLRFGEDVEKDMIAVRVGPPFRHFVVATFAYWDRHVGPTHPRDLKQQSFVAYRNLSSGRNSPWEFEKEGRELQQWVEGGLICNSVDLAMAGPSACTWKRVWPPISPQESWKRCWRTGRRPSTVSVFFTPVAARPRPRAGAD